MGWYACPEGIAWEPTSCPLCAASDEGECLVLPPAADHAEPYRIVECRRCGMIYVNPRPTPATIGKFYTDAYHCHQHDTPTPGLRERFRQYLRRLYLARYLNYPRPALRLRERLLARLAAAWVADADSLTTLPYRGQGDLLDFGCGAGDYLARMQRQGWQVTGVEVSERAAAMARFRHGFPVHVGSLPHPAIEAESFDLITMASSLEHVHHPHAVIAAAAAALRPGGQLVIVVPNIANAWFRRYGVSWYGVEAPIHLLHFTPATLGRLVEAHGLTVRETRLLGRPSWIRQTLKAARKQHPADACLWLGKFSLGCRLLARWSEWTGQADYLRVTAEKTSSGARRQAA